MKILPRQVPIPEPRPGSRIPEGEALDFFRLREAIWLLRGRNIGRGRDTRPEDKRLRQICAREFLVPAPLGRHARHGVSGEDYIRQALSRCFFSRRATLGLSTHWDYLMDAAFHGNC